MQQERHAQRRVGGILSKAGLSVSDGQLSAAALSTAHGAHRGSHGSSTELLLSLPTIFFLLPVTEKDIWIHGMSIPRMTLDLHQSKPVQNPNFTDRETKIRRREGMCLVSLRKSVSEPP